MGSKEHDHNEGQKDGAQADFLSGLVEALNPLTSPEYKAGFWHGMEQQQNAKSKD